MMALSAFIMLTPLAAKGAHQAQKENTIKSEKKETKKSTKSEPKIEVKPSIPLADHKNRGKVFLEEGDSLLRHEGNDYFTLIDSPIVKEREYMKTDIQIAQETKLEPIVEVAKKIGDKNRGRKNTEETKLLMSESAKASFRFDASE